MHAQHEPISLARRSFSAAMDVRTRRIRDVSQSRIGAALQRARFSSFPICLGHNDIRSALEWGD